jgi:hypothetical protein
MPLGAGGRPSPVRILCLAPQRLTLARIPQPKPAVPTTQTPARLARRPTPRANRPRWRARLLPTATVARASTASACAPRTSGSRPMVAAAPRLRRRVPRRVERAKPTCQVHKSAPMGTWSEAVAVVAATAPKTFVVSTVHNARGPTKSQTATSAAPTPLMSQSASTDG